MRSKEKLDLLSFRLSSMVIHGKDAKGKNWLATVVGLTINYDVITLICVGGISSSIFTVPK